ncbi:MAG: enoyl-CoA hydratase-related protein, partial [Calditrichota bacterium]
GVICAADYVIATDRASTKLSEMALGFGPFVIGPVVERRIGAGPFAAMTVDTDWRDAKWAERHGMFAQVVTDIDALDDAVNELTDKLASSNPDAMMRLKNVFWQGTDHWDDLLADRARMSGELVLSDFASKAIGAFRK